MSNKLYMNCVDNVVNAEMQWHNKISLNNIIYRLTMDVNLIDDTIRTDCQRLFESLVSLFGGLLILNIFFPGYFAIVTLIFFLIVKNLLSRFLETTSVFLIKLNRSQSDMFSSFIIAQENVVSLRSLREDNYFYPQLIHKSDKY